MGLLDINGDEVLQHMYGYKIQNKDSESTHDMYVASELQRKTGKGIRHPFGLHRRRYAGIIIKGRCERIYGDTGLPCVSGREKPCYECSGFWVRRRRKARRRLVLLVYMGRVKRQWDNGLHIVVKGRCKRVHGIAGLTRVSGCEEPSHASGRI